VYEELLANHKFDYLLDLDITSPLRTFEDIEQALYLLINRPEAHNLFSVNPAARNPYFNMVEEKGNGFYSLVKTNTSGSVMTRQSAPRVFDMNASFYWYRRSFFELGIKTAITEKSMIYQMNHICFDLDHPVDFLFMEYLLQNDKLDFKL
jgi:CMP-N,N'-diacetyllegionaminic acid synthase